MNCTTKESNSAGKFLYLEVSKLINEKEILELEWHHFATPNELMALGTEHQQ